MLTVAGWQLVGTVMNGFVSVECALLGPHRVSAMCVIATGSPATVSGMPDVTVSSP